MTRAVGAVLLCILSSSCTLVGAGVGAGTAKVQNGLTDGDPASVGAYAVVGALAGLVVDVLLFRELKGKNIFGLDN